MTSLRAASLLGAAVVVFVGGSAVGAKLAFAPNKDDSDTTADCTVKHIAKGQKVSAGQVTVNVFNASSRSGLANDVGNQLEERGFLTGQVTNNPTTLKANSVTIITNNAANPVVRLVARQFNNRVTYVRPTSAMPMGVNVLLGTHYNALFDRSATTIVADRPTTVCVPPVDVD